MVSDFGAEPKGGASSRVSGFGPKDESSAPDAEPSGRATGDVLLDRMFDAVLDGALVGLALWTLCFHLSIFLGARADLTAGFWLASCVAAAFLWRRLLPSFSDSSTGARPEVRVNPVVAASTAFLGVSLAAVAGWGDLNGRRWDLFWLAVIAVTTIGIIIVLTRPAQPGLRRRPRGGILVLGVALMLTALTTGGRFWSSDDVVIVNRSVAIENDGGSAFPLRDTLYSDEVFAYSRPDDPPTSVEALIGTIARAVPMPAPTIAYLFVSPLATALLVLALHRFLRALRAPAPALATAIGVGFIFFGASRGAAAFQAGLGSLHQGKFILNLVVIPLAWRHGLVWSRDGDRRALVLLVATGIAGVGLSTTSLFVLPIVIGVSVIAGAACSEYRVRRMLLATLALAYPIGSGIFALTAGPQPPLAPPALEATRLLVATAFRGSASIPPLAEPAGAWWFSIGRGATAALATAAILLAWLAVRDRASRLTLLAAPFVLFGGLFAPPVFDLMARTWNAKEVLWREVWILPIAACIGLTATAPALLRESVVRRVLLVSVPVALTTLMLFAGTPQTKRFQYWTLRPPPWDIRGSGVRPAERLGALVGPSGVVAGPQAVEEVIAATRNDIRTVNPRPRELDNYRRVAPFHYPERVVVSEALRGARAPLNFQFGKFAAALSILGVDAVCFDRNRPAEWATPMRALGYVEAGKDRFCTYWRRSAVDGNITPS